MYVSEISTVAPDAFKTELQKRVYQMLDTLNIEYSRVDTAEVVTMEDCRLVNEKLSMDMVKTLFVCNSKKDTFYLVVTSGSKTFNSKAFAAAVGSTRVSFAPSELLEQMLGVTIGAATIFSKLLIDSAPVQVVIDSEIAGSQWYGCSDGTTTGYMKLAVADVLQKFLPHVGHRPLIVEL
ncbi:prolyl-tRNA synthetase associated domain-containing protein [Pseudomonas aeruginosa]|nr:hypothetical protein [Pseudomonas aeruginosa]